ncbi:hypothetical protein CapIbe_011979 [Capra ibex]
MSCTPRTVKLGGSHGWSGCRGPEHAGTEGEDPECAVQWGSNPGPTSGKLCTSGKSPVSLSFSFMTVF